MFNLDADLQEKYEAMAKELGAKNPQLSSNEDEEDASNEFYLEDTHDDGFQERLASGSLSYYPGCCGIAILHDARGDDKYLRLLFQLREEIAARANKGMLHQTHVADHTQTQRICHQLGYRMSRPFYNPNTGHTVRLWTKAIQQNQRGRR